MAYTFTTDDGFYLDTTIPVSDDLLLVSAWAKSENVDLWKAKGYALRSLERNDEAITCFEKSQEIDSEDADIWIWKGCSLFDLDKYDEANLCCDKALELDSENQVALDLKARIFKTIE